MKKNKNIPSTLVVVALVTLAAQKAGATSLSIGADYLLRGVAIEERDKTVKNNRYYDQRLQAYMTTDLSKDVEASVRIQSITPWGMEGSSNALVTRYPNADGTPWIQHAYVRLPNIWKERIIVTAGRQPITWGDGTILSDDDLGFNAIRATIKSPFRRIPFELDGFTAKISEGMTGPGDKDLHGAMLGFDSKSFRWEFMGLWEKSDATENYQVGASTIPFGVDKTERVIYGVRARTNLRDAYLKGEYYLQSGKVRDAATMSDVKLEGSGYLVGLGGKQNNTKFGRFGAVLELAVGSGDDPNTTDKDEAFKPTFASRWTGLERKGYGRYFAATMSDAYSPNAPFAPASSSNTGLPGGTSGIQSIHFGIEATPWSQWTFLLDYFQYKAQKTVAGEKELGTEFDYAFVYRYSGLVSVRGSTNIFTPGKAFAEETRQKGKWSGIEIELNF